MNKTLKPSHLNVGNINRAKPSSRWIAGFTVLVFLAVQSHAAYASLISPSQSIPKSNFKSAALSSESVITKKNFSVTDCDLVTGALRSSKQYQVVSSPVPSSKAVDYRLMNEIYFNTLGQVQYILDYDANGIASRRDFNYRADGALLRIDTRKSDDLNTPVEFATYFKGSKGKEAPVYVVTFDPQGTILSVHSLAFNARTGALNRIDEKQDTMPDAPMVSQTFFSGVLGQEDPVKILDYDSQGNRVVNQIDCTYQGRELKQLDVTTDNSFRPIRTSVFLEKGAINHEVTFDNNQGAALFLEGKPGSETPLYAVAFDASGNILLRKDFVLQAAGGYRPTDSNLSEKALPAPSGNSAQSIYRPVTAFSQLPINNEAGLYRRNHFEFDRQGLLSQIDVRAGPALEAISLWKGAN